jgi:hypothetical protein
VERLSAGASWRGPYANPEGSFGLQGKCPGVNIQSGSELISILELENLLEVGKAICTAALHRPESRGAIIARIILISILYGKSEFFSNILMKKLSALRNLYDRGWYLLIMTVSEEYFT